MRPAHIRGRRGAESAIRTIAPQLCESRGDGDEGVQDDGGLIRPQRPVESAPPAELRDDVVQRVGVRAASAVQVKMTMNSYHPSGEENRDRRVDEPPRRRRPRSPQPLQRRSPPARRQRANRGTKQKDRISSFAAAPQPEQRSRQRRAPARPAREHAARCKCRPPACPQLVNACTMISGERAAIAPSSHPSSGPIREMHHNGRTARNSEANSAQNVDRKTLFGDVRREVDELISPRCEDVRDLASDVHQHAREHRVFHVGLLFPGGPLAVDPGVLVGGRSRSVLRPLDSVVAGSRPSSRRSGRAASFSPSWGSCAGTVTSAPSRPPA